MIDILHARLRSLTAAKISYEISLLLTSAPELLGIPLRGTGELARAATVADHSAAKQSSRSANLMDVVHPTVIHGGASL